MYHSALIKFKVLFVTVSQSFQREREYYIDLYHNDSWANVEPRTKY